MENSVRGYVVLLVAYDEIYLDFSYRFAVALERCPRSPGIGNCRRFRDRRCRPEAD